MSAWLITPSPPVPLPPCVQPLFWIILRSPHSYVPQFNLGCRPHVRSIAHMSTDHALPHIFTAPSHSPDCISTVPCRAVPCRAAVPHTFLSACLSAHHSANLSFLLPLLVCASVNRHTYLSDCMLRVVCVLGVWVGGGTVVPRLFCMPAWIRRCKQARFTTTAPAAICCKVTPAVGLHSSAMQRIIVCLSFDLVLIQSWLNPGSILTQSWFNPGSILAPWPNLDSIPWLHPGP